MRVKKFRFQKFISDVASLLTSSVASFAINFVISLILARQLGPEKKGILTSVLVLPSIVQSFADLGIRQATTYYLGKKIYPDQLVISTALFLGMITSLLSTLIVFVGYIMLRTPQMYGWGVVSIALVFPTLRLFSAYARGILLAKQNIRGLAIANLLDRIALLLLLLLIILLFRKVLNVEVAIFFHVLAAGISTSYLLMTVKKYGRLIPEFVRGFPRKFLSLGIIYAAALFILSLNYRVDIVILEKLSSAYQVGIYSVGVNIAEQLWLLPVALTTVNFARSSTARDAKAHAQKTAKLLRISFWLATIPGIALFVTSPWLIPFFYGYDYIESVKIIQVILPGILMVLIFKVLNSDLAGRGKPGTALWVYFLALLVNIALNVLWAPVYGAIGSAWASTVSYTLGAIMFTTVYARISQVSFRELFIPSLADFKSLFPS